MFLKGTFSNRELDVIRLIVFEYTTQEIANALFLSYDTIKTHRKNIIRKLKVKNTAGIVRKAFEIGIITTDSNLSKKPGAIYTSSNKQFVQTKARE